MSQIAVRKNNISKQYSQQLKKKFEKRISVLNSESTSRSRPTYDEINADQEVVQVEETYLTNECLDTEVLNTSQNRWRPPSTIGSLPINSLPKFDKIQLIDKAV